MTSTINQLSSISSYNGNLFSTSSTSLFPVCLSHSSVSWFISYLPKVLFDNTIKVIYQTGYLKDPSSADGGKTNFKTNITQGHLCLLSSNHMIAIVTIPVCEPSIFCYFLCTAINGQQIELFVFQVATQIKSFFSRRKNTENQGHTYRGNDLLTLHQSSPLLLSPQGCPLKCKGEFCAPSM